MAVTFLEYASPRSIVLLQPLRKFPETSSKVPPVCSRHAALSLRARSRRGDRIPNVRDKALGVDLENLLVNCRLAVGAAPSVDGVMARYHSGNEVRIGIGGISAKLLFGLGGRLAGIAL